MRKIFLSLLLIQSLMLQALNTDLIKNCISDSDNETITSSYTQNLSATIQQVVNIAGTIPEPLLVVKTPTQTGNLDSPSWTPVPNLQYNMSVIGKIQLSPAVFSLNENDIVGAFVGTECRGIASPFVSFEGILFLTIGSNVQSGETVTIKIYLSSTNEIIDAIETIPFQNAGELGTMANPFMFTYSTFSVTPSNQSVPASPAGSTNFTVTSNSSWTASSNQPWCTVTPSGSGSGTVVAIYAVNATASQRIDSITVIGSGLTPVVVRVTQDPCTPPTSPTLGITIQPTCSAATGSVVVSGLPAGSWTINPGSITGSSANTTISNLAPGTYNFTVTNAIGCTSSASANVVISAQPAAPAALTVGIITQPTCSVTTGSVILSGLPTGNWTINPGAITGSFSSTTIPNLAAGTYNFTVTNSVGCISAASANVVISAQPAQPTAPTVGTITQPTCSVATGSVVLSGLPAGSWTINPGAITGSTATTTIPNLAAGTYNFTVTNSVGCISSASANVVISAQPAAPTAPIVSSITQSTCSVAAGSVVLSGLPAGSWTINPGAITGSTGSTTISGLAAGTYNFTVTNAAGCISSATANMVISAQPATPTAPIVGTITQPTCALATGSIALSGLPTTGTWTLTRVPGGTTTTGTGTNTILTGLAAGTYTYTITNAVGCTSVESANVVINTQSATPSVINQTTSILTGGTFTVTPGGVPVETKYTWTIPTYAGGVTGGNAQTISQSNISGSLTIPSGTGTATYTVTPTSGSCIGATFTLTVTVTSSCVPVTVGIQPADKNMCVGSGNATFTIGATGTAPFIYQWQYNNGGTWATVTNGIPAGASYTNATTETLNVTGITTAGSPQYRCYITNCSSGKTATSNAVTLTVNAIPTVPTVTTLITNALHSDATNGNQWYNQNGLVNGATAQDFTPSSSGDYYVIVTVNGCTSNSSDHFIYTGIDPIETNKSIKVYPNPVTNELVIEIEGNTTKTDFEVLNSLGQVVFTGNMVEKAIVQTSSFTPGMYLIKLESGKTFEFKKIMKN